MLVRTVARLWTPRYFTRQVEAGRRLGRRRVRCLEAQITSSTKSAKVKSTEAPCRAHTCAFPYKNLHKKSLSERAPLSPSGKVTADQRRISVAQPKPPVDSRGQNPLAQRAHELLHLFASVDHQPPSVSPDVSRSYAAFSARRDVFGPLRGLLPSPTTSSSDSNVSPAPLHRFRVVPEGDVSPMETSDPQRTASSANDFSLSDLILFFRLYDSADVEDGRLLLQLMGEIRRKLLALAETRVDGDASSTRTVTSSSARRENDLEEGISAPPIMSKESNASPLPLPVLLYTMASLGIAEEAVLEVIVNSAMKDGTHSRCGIVYAQLRFYSVRELLQLIVALHRFGHSQHLSTKAVTKVIRGSFYSTTTTAGRFHKRARDLKKALVARPGTPPPSEEPCLAAVDKSDAGGVAALTLADKELCSLAFQLECPLFLLLEALTAATATVYRRADVVSFLSDLIAVTAVVELTTAVQECHGRQRTTGCIDLAEETREFILAVSHQLLRAAKLTEGMELPQLLLSTVFSWSTTLSGRGVVVDGDEDSPVPSDRIAYYDHVTADLIKVNTTE